MCGVGMAARAREIDARCIRCAPYMDKYVLTPGTQRGLGLVSLRNSRFFGEGLFAEKTLTRDWGPF